MRTKDVLLKQNDFATRSEFVEFASLQQIYVRERRSLYTTALMLHCTVDDVITMLKKYEISLIVTRPIIGQDGRRRETSNGYVELCVNGKWVLEHRYVWEQAIGPIPDGWIVHHINGIRDDNRLENLIGLPRTEHSTSVYQDVMRKRVISLEEQVVELENLVKGYEKILNIGTLQD